MLTAGVVEVKEVPMPLFVDVPQKLLEGEAHGLVADEIYKVVER